MNKLFLKVNRFIRSFLLGYKVDFLMHLQAQYQNNKSFAKIDFDHVEQDWDGFGINYVVSCQIPDYRTKPQDLGGFSALNENQKQEIIELVFGEDGLRPAIIKMFLDPWHLSEKSGR